MGELYVFGNAQDGVGNTMNAGKIVVHGKAVKFPAIRCGAERYLSKAMEYRAGIHMKEYLRQIPLLIIGGTAKDFCGEYMAGGNVIILNLERKGESAVGYSVGTGIHGGAIFIRGNVDPYQLGIGAVFSDVTDDDIRFLRNALKEFSGDLTIEIPIQYTKSS